VLVPAGESVIGVDPVVACQSNSANNCEERYKTYNPLRTVFLETFYIDKYEVTNSTYQDCVLARECSAPSDIKLGNIDYFGNKSYDEYPVIWVSRDQAIKYCAWRGARLPSSEEWEKSSRGTDQRIYPWGNDGDLTSRENGKGNGDGFQYTAPVGSFPLGLAPYGAFDMAGNVSEFVSDNITYVYSWGTYTYPMTKGGEYYWGVEKSYMMGGGRSYFNIGFRCAKSIP
jgi:formylglycine-generating enzyme required for sulfatase activity